MAPQDQQLEKLVDEALKSSNVQALEDFIQEDISERTTLKCSKQFLTKLDKLINRELNQRNARNASLGVSILHRCGKNLVQPGGQGLSEMVSQGLVKKWYEKARQLWVEAGTQSTESTLLLAEDFFDALMAVHEASKAGTYQVTESLLYPIGQLAADPRVHIVIQKEAIRKLNLILDKIPEELKREKKILSSQEASGVMSNLAGRILEGGDYDLQIALMEALCRMTTRGQRKELTNRWFTMEFVASAFIKIQDSEFETDCRKFLNLVNGMQGDGRRVFSFPCLEVFLDKHELLMPSDEKLEEFWIDFNLGSQSISFYFSLGDERTEEGQWDTVCIPETEVHSYSVTEEGRRCVLRLKLSEPVCMSKVEGSNLAIHFSSSLDILQAARSIYGHSKNKTFVGKRGTSVVKTTVEIIMDESNSQGVVPESQVSLITEREKSRAPCVLPPCPTPLQRVTPGMRRVSESSSYISREGGARGITVVMPASTPSSRAKMKPVLDLVRSRERESQPSLGELRTTKSSSKISLSGSTLTHSSKEQMDASLQSRHSGQDIRARVVAEKYRRNIPVEKVVEIVQADQDVKEETLCTNLTLPDDQTFVPDTQPTTKKERTKSVQCKVTSLKAHISVSETLLPAQRSVHKALPKPESVEQQVRPSSAQRGSASSVPGSDPVSHKQLHAQLTQRLQEVLREREQQERAGSRERAGPREQGGTWGRGSAERSGSKSREPEERGGPAGRGPREPKSKDQEPVPVKAPIKPIPAKVLQERVTPNPKVKPTGPNSSKERSDVALTGSMAKLISSHYKNSNTISSVSTATRKNTPPLWNPPLINRSLFAKSWLPSAKKETFLKSYSNPTKNSGRQHGEDVFAFNSPISIGAKRKKSTGSSAIDSSAIYDSWALPSTTKKDLAVKPRPPKRHVKKHLFSDTDTDAMTEVSWLRASGRKPKPKVTDYTRQPSAKPRPPAPDTTFESPDLPPASKKTVKEKAKPKKKRAGVRDAGGLELEQRKEPPPAARGRATMRPRRAAATAAKSYKEPNSDSHDSQSETEQPPAPKKRSSGQQEKSERVVQEVAEVKKKKPAAPTKSYKESYNDSQSETEQPPAPKKRTSGKQEMSERIVQEVAEVKKKKAAAPTKSYQESYNDSQSETEQPPAPKKRFIGEEQKKNERVVQDVCAEVEKKKTALAKQQTSVPKDSWDTRFGSFSLSPPPVERMRCKASPTAIERSEALPGTPLTPLGFLTASPVCSGPPSPVVDLPKPPRSSGSNVGIQPSSFYGTGRKSGSKAVKNPSPPPLPSPTPVLRAPRPSLVEPQLSPIQQALSSAHSPPLSEFSQPPLTSTALEKSLPASPLCSQFTTGDTLNQGIHFDKGSLVSRVTLSQSSSVSVMSVSRVQVNPVATATELEKTPYFDHEGKPVQQQYHVSGPSHTCHNPNSSPSNSEEEEEEQEDKKKRGKKSSGQALKMRPRKLFKSSANPILDDQAENWEEQSSSEEEEEEKKKGRGMKDGVSRATKTSYHHIQSKSAHETGLVSCRAVSSSHWEASVEEEEEEIELELPDVDDSPQDMGAMCRRFSSELQKKCQNRTRKMELYTKRSLKTIQQHVSSVGVQVSKHRSQKLEQIRVVLLDEIINLEQDDSTLKTMEKELTIYWRKQSVAFHSYQEKETQRLQSLKRAFQTNTCHSLEYEEQIFTSQMCLMRKDMKSVQDRLIKEMQEEEILSVRRGLQALFMPEGPRF